MIRSGFVIEDPKTHIKVIVLKTEVEMKSRGWLLEHHFPPFAESNVPKHLHLTWVEMFEIISGTAFYILGDNKKMANAGDIIVMPPGVPHVHPWNAGGTELVYRQQDDFNEENINAVQDVMGVFATRAGLSRDGLCDKRGRPLNPLQSAVTLKLLASYGGYDASIPIPVQNFLAATIGTLAQQLGYKAVIQKYLVSADG